MAKGPGLYSDIGKKARGTLSNCVEILNYDHYRFFFMKFTIFVVQLY